MKNSFKNLLGGTALAVGLLISNAQAAMIVGEINLSGIGAVTLINNVGLAGAPTPNNADAIDFPAGVNLFVSAGSGDFGGMGGTFGTITDFAFNPGLSPSPVNPLWMLANGFSFSLDAITLINQSTSGFLNLKGNGRFNGGSFEETPGLWSFTVTTTGSLFTWTSGNNSVPDSGSTLVLLGAGLIATAAFHRRKKAI